jgi:hypothetical protein
MSQAKIEETKEEDIQEIAEKGSDGNRRLETSDRKSTCRIE